MPQARFVVVDPSLRSFQGHHFEYSFSVSQAARRAGFRPFIFTNAEFFADTAADGVSCVPCFTSSQYGPPNADWLRELSEASGELRLNQNDHLFIHTVQLHEFKMIAEWIEDPGEDSLPALHLLFRRDLNEFSRGDKLQLERIFRNLSYAPRAWSLRFYTDTAQLADQYNEFLRFSRYRFTQLPIPFRHELLPLDASRGNQPLTVAYLGDARPEKGFGLLPDLARAAAEKGYLPGKMRLLIQSNFNIPGGEEGMREALAGILRFRNLGIEFQHGPFCPERYAELLTSSDIVLLPYVAPLYQRRSSGILAEAMVAGKVTVAPQGTWMASELDTTRAVTYRSPGDFPAAVLSAVDRFPQLAQGARQFALQYRKRNSPDTLVEALTAPPPPQAPSPNAGPKVLYVMDADCFLNSTGSMRTALNQLRCLTEAGFEIYCLLTIGQVFTERVSAVDDDLQIAEALRPFNVKGYWICFVPPDWYFEHSELAFLYSRLRREWADKTASFRYETGLRKLFWIPPPFLQLCRDVRFDFALVNYAFNIPILDRLELRDVPMICETHDLQAHQLSFRGSRTPDRDLEEEFRLLERCRSVLFVNDEELAFCRSRLTGQCLVHARPVVNRPPPTYAALAGIVDLRELFVSAVPAYRDRIDCNAEKINAWNRIDLLFVSTHHVPNIESFRWFYERVFRPYLEQYSITCVIAGNIDVSSITGDNALIFSSGRVESLAPLYAAAKVVILPIRQGAGIAIKTLEAIALGKPLVGTPLSFRGLSTLLTPQTHCLIAADAGAFAMRTLALIHGEEERRRCAAVVQGISSSITNFEEYASALGSAIESATGRLPQRECIRKPEPRYDFVEWNEGVQLFNSWLRSIHERGEAEQGAIDQLERDLEDPRHRAICEQLFQTVVSREGYVGETERRNNLKLEWSRVPEQFPSFLAALFPRRKAFANR